MIAARLDRESHRRPNQVRLQLWVEPKRCELEIARRIRPSGHTRPARVENMRNANALRFASWPGPSEPARLYGRQRGKSKTESRDSEARSNRMVASRFDLNMCHCISSGQTNQSLKS